MIYDNVMVKGDWIIEHDMLGLVILLIIGQVF